MWRTIGCSAFLSLRSLCRLLSSAATSRISTIAVVQLPELDALRDLRLVLVGKVVAERLRSDETLLEHEREAGEHVAVEPVVLGRLRPDLEWCLGDPVDRPLPELQLCGDVPFGFLGDVVGEQGTRVDGDLAVGRRGRRAIEVAFGRLPLRVVAPERFAMLGERLVGRGLAGTIEVRRDVRMPHHRLPLIELLIGERRNSAGNLARSAVRMSGISVGSPYLPTFGLGAVPFGVSVAVSRCNTVVTASLPAARWRSSTSSCDGATSRSQRARGARRAARLGAPASGSVAACRAMRVCCAAPFGHAASLRTRRCPKGQNGAVCALHQINDARHRGADGSSQQTESGRGDLNPRPPAPKAGALPLRHSP